MRKLLPPLVAAAVCVAVLWTWTDGSRTFTVFSHALHKAGPVPRAFPDIPLVDHNGTAFHPGKTGKYLLINFVYLDCPDVCHIINNRMEGIHRALSGKFVPEKLEMLTISFDLQRDDVKKLRNYRKQFGAGIDGWTFALPDGLTQGEFDKFLERAGVWARRVPGTALINHSIFQFLVAPNGEIVKIFDPAREDDREIVAQLTSWIQK